MLDAERAAGGAAAAAGRRGLGPRRGETSMSMYGASTDPSLSSREELWAVIDNARALMATPRRTAATSLDSPQAMGVWQQTAAAPAALCAAEYSWHAAHVPADTGTAQSSRVSRVRWPQEEVVRRTSPRRASPARSADEVGAAKARKGRRGGRKGASALDADQKRWRRLLMHAAKGLVPLDAATGEGVAGRAELRRRIAEVQEALQHG